MVVGAGIVTGDTLENLPVPVQSDWLNSALSPVVYGDIALSINT